MRSTLSIAVLLTLATQGFAQVAHWGQCGGNGYSGSTSCASGSSCVKSNEWYSQCIPGASGGSSSSTKTSSSSTKTSTSTKTTSTGATTTTNNGSGPTGVTTVFPAAAGVSTAPSAIKVSGSFDGGMKRFERSTNLCTDSSNETGEDAAMFILEDGATISNAIIGKTQAEGIHCRGSCTIKNVWWEDVCEDAATFKQSGGTSYVIGGGAKGASDKIFQHNGAGTLHVSNFYATDYGKVYRSCGNCKNNGAARHVIFDNVIASGGLLAGINTNYGDTAVIRNTCVKSGKYCDLYTGNNSGKEPSKIGSGPNSSSCIVTGGRTNC